MRIEYATSDAVTIVGEWRDVATPKGWALLLHMMPATKESWASFQEVLASRGIASLAIDLRGHGESKTPELDYRNFSNAEHQASMHDVIGGIAYLSERGAREGKIILAGASIGANLALRAMARDASLRVAMLLSAGFDYRGIEAEEEASALAKQQSVYLVAAADDPNESLEAHRAIARSTQATCELREYDTGGHGTNLFATHPELKNEIADWTVRHLA